MRHSDPLIADRTEIERFVDALFRYASEGGVVSLRAFDDADKGQRAFGIRPVTINGAGLDQVIDAATELATRCGRAKRPIVFCPPVVTFKSAENAKQANVAEGLALSVECDAAPTSARERLESILGPATLVVASGGRWTDPSTGEVQDKLHLHWRLTEPTTTDEDHATLKEARRLATLIVGSDATNIPLVHPIRWPGSWHRKAEPRMARIVALRVEAEIELDDALDQLRSAPYEPGSEARQTGSGWFEFSETEFQPKTREDYAALIAGMAIDGTKHDSIVRVAASLVAQGCSERFVEGFVQHHCPVWDANVEAAIHSGFEKYRVEEAKARMAADTTDPVDLWGSFAPPELPPGLLPPLVERFARLQGELMGADPGGIAVACLVACAAAIPDEVQIRVKVHDDNWTESARLWAALVGLPSTKKTPIISAATAPLCRLDTKMFRDWQSELSEFNKLDKDARKGREPPPQRRLRIEDATIEAAQQVLVGSPWGVLMVQDELSGFFGAMDKYNGGKAAAADRAFWLRTWNGGDYALNRVGRGTVLIDNASVSLLGGIQPDPIRRVAADAQDDGLLQRLFPIILRPATLGTDAPMPDVAAEYGELIRKLRRTRPPQEGLDLNLGTATMVQFDSAAQQVRRNLEARHLDLQSLEQINRKLAAHVGKYDGLFARLCLVWHCVEHADADSLPGIIEGKTAQRVADFLHRFLFRHAVAFYSGVLALSDDHDRLTALAGYILAHGKEEVTNRDVQRSVRAMRNLNERDIRTVFEQLAALGWLEQVPGPRPSSPPRWIVNPGVHVKFADRAAQEARRRKQVRETLDELRKTEA